MKINRLELLDCQVDEILHALQTHMYIYRYAYMRAKTKEAEQEISLMLDTYHTITSQYQKDSTSSNRDISSTLKDLEKKVNNF